MIARPLLCSMRKWLKILASVLVLLLILFYVALYMVVPITITQPRRVSNNLSPEHLNLASESLRWMSFDSIQLDGYWIDSTIDSSKGVMILIHGIGGCKEHFLPVSNKLAHMGIESVIFDSRAHGNSEGDYCTYGYKERRDISVIVDSILTREAQTKIGIWGNSLGGAIALQSLERDKRINFGIIESTFAELDDIVYDYKDRLTGGFGVRVISEYALNRAGELADFDPYEVKPIESVKNIDVPIFIGHGEADENISVKYAKDLYNNLRSADKELYIVPVAGHFNLMKIGGQDYENSVFEFIERNFGDQER